MSFTENSSKKKLRIYSISANTSSLIEKSVSPTATTSGLDAFAALNFSSFLNRLLRH